MARDDLKPFNFSPEIIARMRETQEIPVNFYNANGQVLIPKKEKAPAELINKLLQHIGTGIFYRESDEDKLGIKKSGQEDLEGLTDTKLLSEKRVAELSAAAETLFSELKFAAFSAVHSQKMHSQVNSFIADFEQQPDMMVGIINILDTVKATSSELTKLAVKRAVVAMALKTRSMKAMISKDRGRGSEAVQPVMMSGMLAQIGKAKMNLPEGENLTAEQRAYVRRYPLLSYLMVAHEPTVPFETKRLILNQRRTLPENQHSNNYPELRWMVATLQSLAQNNEKNGKRHVANDIMQQLSSLKEFVVYEEDVNILSLATDFAALTTETSWREAKDPVTAIKMIVNTSYFQYSPKIIRDFLDHISISLSHNQKVIRNGDVLILALTMNSGQTYFEVVKVLEVGRYQSRAFVQRLGVLHMATRRENGIYYGDFLTDTFRPDPRRIKINLAQDFLRRIVYIVDPKIDPKLHDELDKKLKVAT
jgi:HD-GYP domain-containing protein (c-di-GMP phosphodiesterase class II)